DSAGLHWVLDVVFHDDYMRLRTEHGPANMATIRHFAMNLIRGIKDKRSLKVRRKKLGWDEEYLLKTLTDPP
ncbi:ISAs1 family transposase, partial [Desulfosarcina sp. OttesenSCG-928-A07]|nr:ISAs1 family transposase [Desulfosarcina sp. OttesenSCG-928-A07]